MTTTQYLRLTVEQKRKGVFIKGDKTSDNFEFIQWSQETPSFLLEKIILEKGNLTEYVYYNDGKIRSIKKFIKTESEAYLLHGESVFFDKTGKMTRRSVYNKGHIMEQI